MLSDEEKKEFEHLKEKIEINKLYGIDIYLNKEQVKIIENLIKQIEELKKPKYLFNSNTGEITRIDNISDYISKNKIKAKIEELNNPESDTFKSLFNKNELTWSVTIQRILQSLLEDEIKDCKEKIDTCEVEKRGCEGCYYDK